MMYITSFFKRILLETMFSIRKINLVSFVFLFSTCFVWRAGSPHILVWLRAFFWKGNLYKQCHVGISAQNLRAERWKTGLGKRCNMFRGMFQIWVTQLYNFSLRKVLVLHFHKSCCFISLRSYTFSIGYVLTGDHNLLNLGKHSHG